MELRKKHKRSLILNATSLIDVLFLLLIFFMISTTFLSAPAIKLELPKAKHADAVRQEPVVVYVDANGGVFLNDEPLDMALLPAALKGKLDQHALKGPTDTYEEAPLSTTGLDAMDRRICIKFENTEEVNYGLVEDEDEHEHGVPIEYDSPENQMMKQGHRDFIRLLQDRPGRNGFRNREVEISNIMGDEVGHHGGKHAHMEAVLYILAGEGYTQVGEEKVPWKKGSLLHVQGPQTPHQHFNTSSERVEMLRAAPGIRFNFMQRIAAERFPYLWFSHRGVNRE